MLKIRTTTDDSTEAMRLATQLVESRLAASAHTRAVNSVYTWKDVVHNKTEFEVEFLVDDDNEEQIRTEICKIHHYDVPEIIIEKVKASDDINQWCHNWCHGGI